MPMKQEGMLLAILQAAAAEPIGVVIQTSDTARAKSALYRARAASNDPSLSTLQIRTSPWPDEGDLIICHPQAEPKPDSRLREIDLGSVLDIDDLT